MNIPQNASSTSNGKDQSRDEVTAEDVMALLKIVRGSKKTRPSGDGFIQVEPSLVEIAGSAPAALMLAKALYWIPRSRVGSGGFYKSREEWERETGLKKGAQQTARKRLVATGLWREKRTGKDGVMHFWIDFPALLERITAIHQRNLALEAEREAKRRRGLSLVRESDPAPAAPPQAPPDSEDLTVEGPTAPASNLAFDFEPPPPALEPQSEPENERVGWPESGQPKAHQADPNLANRTADFQPSGLPEVGQPVGQVPANPFHVHAETTTNTTAQTLSLGARARENLHGGEEPGEREERVYIFSSEEEKKALIEDLAEKLIALQARQVTVLPKDREAAKLMAASALEREISEEDYLRAAGETMIELAKKPGQITCGLRAVIHFVDRKLLARQVTRYEEERLKEVNRRAEEEREKRQAEANAEWEAYRAEREAVEQKRREEAERKSEEMRAALIEHANGRTVGVSEDEEARAIDYLLGQSLKLEDLKACFDWCAENMFDGCLGWVIVETKWPKWCMHRMKKSAKTQPPSDGRGARTGERPAPSPNQAQPHGPVLQAMARACRLDPDSCSAVESSDLAEAHNLYYPLSRGLSKEGRAAELESFGEWFFSREGRRPGPMEIVNLLSQFRGSDGRE